ncbi:Epoxide hydrolase 4 [Bulinus truncatus]|nr:Epoxide hydrolase 4 [Bulinus truncatus]
MLHLACRLFYLIVGLCWLSLWIVRALIDLVLVGPRKLFYKSAEEGDPPARLQDPVYGEHRYIVIDKVKFHYVISGPEGAPLMLMLHGFPEIWFSWRYQIKEFQKDFRVVALDMKGFGDSDKPKGLQHYKLDVLVCELQKLVEALGYRSCVLVSHDWGGAVAWGFAVLYPEMVNKLIVMNIPPVTIWKHGFTSVWNPVQFLASGYIYLFNLPFFPEYLAGLQDGKLLDDCFLRPPFGVRSGLMSKEDVECYKYFFRKPGALTAAINYYRANLGVDGAHHLLKYPMPVQIIWGCQDIALTIKLLEETVKSVPHAKVVKVPEASHWVQMDQPDKVSAAMRDFLSDNSS